MFDIYALMEKHLCSFAKLFGILGGEIATTASTGAHPLHVGMALEILLQKELSLIFQSQTRAMHGVMVSVTRVRVSPDLSICTAYLSIFPSERGEEIIENIRKNEKTVRYDLGQRVRNQLRIIPELRFFIDDSLDYIEHIDELLKK